MIKIKTKKWKKLNTVKHATIMQKANKRWRSNNLELIKPKRNVGVKARLQLLRNIVIEAYGGKCVCCGETELDFLTLDHIKGDGGVHRRLVGKNTYNWAFKNKYPKELQVLCWNCNVSKSFPRNGNKCLHQLIKEDLND